MHSTVVFLALTSLQHFTLDHLEYFRLDNGFVVILYIILWDFLFVDFGLLGKEVCGVRLLQKGITFILFVFKNAFYSLLIPVCFAARRQDAVIGE